jgi:hypothetical protein
MDQTPAPTPTTRPDRLDTPESEDTPLSQAARQFFTGAAPATTPPSRPVPVPPTTKAAPFKQEPAGDQSAVTAKMSSQINDLHAQVSTLAQQMANLMGIVTQQQLNSTAVAGIQGGAPATDVTKIQGGAESSDVTKTQGGANSNDATTIQGSATYQQINAAACEPSRAAAVHRPSSSMRSAHIFKRTDLQMYEDCQELKPKPINPSIALATFRRIKPQVVKQIQDIKQPGIEADIAISTFISEARAVLNSPGDHTLAAVLTEALTTGSKTVDSTTQNLLRLAVKCGSPGEIYLQAQIIRQTGRYDRSKAALADVTKDTAYNSFNPETDKGKHLWSAILDLLLAYWQRSKSGIADQLALEKEYQNLSCINPGEVSTHLTAEAELYTKLSSAHIIYSDQQRIRAILAGCGKQINTEYQIYKKRKHQDNLWNHLRDTDVNLFAQDLEAVADAMDPVAHHERPQPRDRHNPPRNPQDNPQERPGHDQDRPCWDHQHLAEGCSRGERCPWEHRGEAAAKKLRYQTEDGTCRAFLTDNCDRGDQCKFKHPAKPDADDASAQVNHADATTPKRECRDHKNGRCLRGDQCNFLHVNKPEAAAMHAECPDSSNDDSDEDLYESY